MPRVWNTDYGNVTDAEHFMIERLSKGEQTLHAIIYTKPRCPKCRMTAKLLSRAMPVKTIMVDERDLERFRKLGYKSMPVVTVYKPDGTRDEWCDLRIDKINKYTEETTWK